MTKKVTVTLTIEELDLILTALPMVTDREVEEEVDHEERIGEECDELADKLRILKRSHNG